MRFMGDYPVKGQSEQDLVSTMLKVLHSDQRSTPVPSLDYSPIVKSVFICVCVCVVAVCLYVCVFVL